MDEVLYTFKEAARRLKVRPETVSDLIKRLHIRNFPHPANGKAKAIGAEGLKALRHALRERPPRPTAG